MMTYKEYMDYQYRLLSWWRKFLFRMTCPPDWRGYYYEYTLKCILKSKDLDEAKEKAVTALGGKS